MVLRTGKSLVEGSGFSLYTHFKSFHVFRCRWLANKQQQQKDSSIPADWHLTMRRAVRSQWVGNGTRVALGPQWVPLHFKIKLLSEFKLLSFYKRGPLVWDPRGNRGGRGRGFPCGGRKGPHPAAWEVSRDSALSWVPLPCPAPGRTRVRTPRPPPRGESSPGCGPAGLGGQGAARAKGEGPAAASVAACGGGRRGRTRAEGEGSHLGEVPGWSQSPGAERFSCPPRLSPADPERSFPEKNAPRAAEPRSRPEPPRGKRAAPRHAGRGVRGVGGQTGGVSGPRSPLGPAVPPAREEGAAAVPGSGHRAPC